MSTTAMWLLLAVVIVVILFGSVLYKRTFTTKELALTGVMAALSLVAYLFFRVPFYGGSSFHLGNTFTALTALLLDGVSGGLAGAIGSVRTAPSQKATNCTPTRHVVSAAAPASRGAPNRPAHSSPRSAKRSRATSHGASSLSQCSETPAPAL